MRTTEIQKFLDIHIHQHQVDFDILETHETPHYKRHLIQYTGSEEDIIPAYLFMPTHTPIIGSILVHHQHHSERHLGKSEVAGIIGDPCQFFCPALAEHGVITLAPDSICFEDRRTNQSGREPAEDPEDDFLQHYNEMCYRILRGTTLMKKVIEDSSIGISLLTQLPETPQEHLGILGHSYGGNTVLFHSPFDPRIKYSCSSGAVCSYRTKFKYGTGIEMAEVIPGFTEKYDIQDFLKLISPRSFLILASTEDQFSQEAHEVYQELLPFYEQENNQQALSFKEFQGGHDLTPERTEFIIQWFVNQFKRN